MTHRRSVLKHPAAMPSTNPYTLLGVDEHASARQIAVAYRRLAHKYHPDVNGGDAGKTEHFKALAAGYYELRDQSRRKEVDARLRRERAVPSDGRRPAAAQRTRQERSRAATSARRTGSSAINVRPTADRARRSVSPFMDIASKISKSRPASERLGWLFAGALADLLASGCK